MAPKEAPMASRNYAEHARVTAICVNLALDGVEADIQEELEWVTNEAAAALRRILARMKERRIAEGTPSVGTSLLM
jgi:hypothetical protein